MADLINLIDVEMFFRIFSPHAEACNQSEVTIVVNLFFLYMKQLFLSVFLLCFLREILSFFFALSFLSYFLVDLFFLLSFFLSLFVYLSFSISISFSVFFFSFSLFYFFYLSHYYNFFLIF